MSSQFFMRCLLCRITWFFNEIHQKHPRIPWFRRGKKKEYMTQYENITKCPINHKKLIKNLSYLGQISTKMTEKYAENNNRWLVITYMKLFDWIEVYVRNGFFAMVKIADNRPYFQVEIQSVLEKYCSCRNFSFQQMNSKDQFELKFGSVRGS